VGADEGAAVGAAEGNGVGLPTTLRDVETKTAFALVTTPVDTKV